MKGLQPSKRDLYPDFGALAAAEKKGKDYRVTVRNIPGASTIIVAPHGGGIEPGTTEIADNIAGNDFSFYTFAGIKPGDNTKLHLTSTRFDEPDCVDVIPRCGLVLAIHGEDSKEPVVFIGGLDRSLQQRLTVALEKRGFAVRNHPNDNLQGLAPSNICNRGSSGAGVQLELSAGLRREFFQSLKAIGRKTTTRRFADFVTAVREGLTEE